MLREAHPSSQNWPQLAFSLSLSLSLSLAYVERWAMNSAGFRGRMLNQQWILIQDSIKVQSTSIFSCLPLGLIRWLMPRHKLLGPVMHTLGVWPIHNTPPSVHYMPKLCIIRHKKLCPGSRSTKMCPIITRQVLVEHLGQSW